MKEDIQAGTKIIAEFSDAWVYNEPDLTRSYKGEYYRHKEGDYVVNDCDMKYHTSWDWQIPVWSKIAKLSKEVAAKGGDDCYKKYISFLDRYENAVFDNKPEIGQSIITEALQWYNQQTPKPDINKKQ